MSSSGKVGALPRSSPRPAYARMASYGGFESAEARRREGGKQGSGFLIPALAGMGGVLFVAFAAFAGSSGSFGYGKPATPAEIAGWNIDVRGDDGVGLPDGKGAVEHGADVFAQACAACHGTFGEGEGRYPKLMGGEGTLASERPEPSVGSYWPFAPTLFDYINRAMPLSAPHTLPADDVYALIAYILHFNNIVPNNFVADRDSLAKVKMPNRDNFIWKDPRPDTAAKTCMKDCIDPKSVKIISSAEGKGLTPRTTGPLDNMNGK